MYELSEIASSGEEYIIRVKSYEKLQKAIRRAAYAKIGKLRWKHTNRCCMQESSEWKVSDAFARTFFDDIKA